MEPVRAGEIHPLQNPSILKIVFENKKLTLEDLKSCRQVCREWRSGSNSAMRKLMPLIRVYRERGKRIGDFVKLVKVTGGRNAFSVPPFMEKFKIFDQKLGRHDRRFWRFCRSSIKILELSFVSFKSRDEFRFAILQSCPNLEALTLSNITVEGERVEEPSEWVPLTFPPNHNLTSLRIFHNFPEALSWMDILSQFPALEKFEQPEGSAGEFLRCLAVARNHDPECGNIKDLRFHIGLLKDPLAVLPALEDRTLPLETLHLDKIRPECLAALKRVLVNRAPTLKTLTLRGEYRREVIIPLPNNEMFQSLEALHVHQANLEWPTFLRSFPNLKRLELTHISAVRPTEERFGNWTSSCTELQIFMDCLEPEDLRQLFARLPNLKKLEASQCTNHKFALICEFLPSLEHLILNECKVDDVGFSGLNEEEVARINEAGDEGLWPLKETRPNISRLQNLKWFSLRIDWTWGRRPDYTTAIFLLRLPQLQHLHIPKTSAHPIWSCLKKLLPWRE